MNFRPWELIFSQFQIPDESKLLEDGVEVLLVGIIRVIFERNIDNRSQILCDFVIWMVRDDIPSFQMIGEENLKVRVYQRLNWGVDVVVVSTGVWSILHSEVLNKGKILNYFNVLYFPVLAHQFRDCVLVDVVKTANEQLSHQNDLMNFLRWTSLYGQLFLLSLRKMEVCLLKFFVEVQVVISQAQSYFLLQFFFFSLFISLIAFTKLKKINTLIRLFSYCGFFRIYHNDHWEIDCVKDRSFIYTPDNPAISYGLSSQILIENDDDNAPLHYLANDFYCNDPFIVIFISLDRPSLSTKTYIYNFFLLLIIFLIFYLTKQKYFFKNIKLKGIT